MSDINSSIFQAVDIIVDKKLSELTFDKTVKAEIVEVVNIDIGKYKIKYDGGTFDAYAQDLEAIYNVKDAVYVKIVKNDLSDKRIIVGKVEDTSLIDQQSAAAQIKIIPSGLPFDKILNYDPSKTYKITVGEGSTDYIIFSDEVDEADEADVIDQSILKSYEKLYSYIQIKAKFLTHFTNRDSTGNYGIEIVLQNETGSITQNIKLDSKDFLGYPYQLTSWSEQSIVVKLSDELEDQFSKVVSIKLYQTGFKSTDPANRSNVNTEPFNISCKDLDIQFVKYLNLAEDIFTLNVNMPNGNVFKRDVTEELSFTAELWRQNNVFKSSDIKYTWYIQDYSVTLTKGYTFLGGVRWRKLNEVSDTLHLEYDANAIMNHKYKVIASYKNKNYSMIFDVRYNEAPIYTIQKIGEENKILLYLYEDGVQLEKTDDHDFILYQEDENGNYAQLMSVDSYPFDVTQLLDNNVATWYIDYIKKNPSGDELIGEAEYFYIQPQDTADFALSYEGQQVYHYDANGDINLMDNVVNRTLSIKVNWPKAEEALLVAMQIYIGNYRVPDGEASSDEGNLNNTMMENVYLTQQDDQTFIFHYNIKTRYNVTTNNTLKIIVMSYGKGTQIEYKTILFSKDGEQGTNGTAFQVLLGPANKDNSGNYTLNLGDTSGFDLKYTYYEASAVCKNADSGSNVPITITNTNSLINNLGTFNDKTKLFNNDSDILIKYTNEYAYPDELKQFQWYCTDDKELQKLRYYNVINGIFTQSTNVQYITYNGKTNLPNKNIIQFKYEQDEEDSSWSWYLGANKVNLSNYGIIVKYYDNKSVMEHDTIELHRIKPIQLNEYGLDVSIDTKHTNEVHTINCSWVKSNQARTPENIVYLWPGCSTQYMKAEVYRNGELYTKDASTRLYTWEAENVIIEKIQANIEGELQVLKDIITVYPNGKNISYTFISPEARNWIFRYLRNGVPVSDTRTIAIQEEDLFGPGVERKSGLYIFKYNDGQWYWDNDPIKLTISKSDTETIIDGDIIELTLLENPRSRALSNMVYSPEKQAKYYVKVAISIMYGDSITYVSSYYPLTVFISEYTEEVQSDEKYWWSNYSIQIPKYIQYSSSGMNPVFNNAPLQVLDANGTTVGELSVNEIIDPNTDEPLPPEYQLLSIDNTRNDGTKYLIPAYTFTFINENIGSLKWCKGKEESPTGPIQSNKSFIYPIFMYLNTFGHESINGWDGTSILLNDKGHTILAPQIGAGTKDPMTNTFTGVIMGKDNQENKTGLYGYKDGLNTFSFTEDGNAYFGMHRQISIEGDNAVITGRNNRTGSPYMTLNLTQGDENTKAIQIGNNFSVDYNGRVSIGADNNIEGYIPEDDEFYNDSKSHMTFDDDKIAITSGQAGMVLDATSLNFYAQLPAEIPADTKGDTWLNNTGLHIKQGEIEEQLILGNYLIRFEYGDNNTTGFIIRYDAPTETKESTI